MMTTEEKETVKELANRVGDVLSHGTFFASSIEGDAFNLDFDFEVWIDKTVLALHNVNKLLEGE
jgi:hypothetical protein